MLPVNNTSLYSRFTVCTCHDDHPLSHAKVTIQRHGGQRTTEFLAQILTALPFMQSATFLVIKQTCLGIGFCWHPGLLQEVPFPNMHGWDDDCSHRNPADNVSFDWRKTWLMSWAKFELVQLIRANSSQVGGQTIPNLEVELARGGSTKSCLPVCWGGSGGGGGGVGDLMNMSTAPYALSQHRGKTLNFT